MRLSLILLVVAAFVSTLDATVATSDANTVVSATNTHESIASARFLRAHHEDDYLVKDELDEEDSDDDKENDEERMFSFLKEKATALSASKKLVSKSGDDLTEAVSALSKGELVALFNQGQSHMAKIVPGFRPGMSSDDFSAAVKSARLDDDTKNALVVGYGKYLAHHM